MDARNTLGISPPALIDLELDRHLQKSLDLQISDYFRSSIATGALRMGARLPTTRDLARRLGTTRNAVVVAYDQLISEGLVEGRGRQGTFIVDGVAPAPGKLEQDAHPLLLRRDDPAAAGEDIRQPHLDWWPGQARPYALPDTTWRNAFRKAGNAGPPVGVGDPQGEPGLRQAIAAWLATHRAIAVDASHIIVTRGIADFLMLLSQHLIRTGDRCAIEDPGHPLVRRALLKAGADLDHVPVDDEGLMVGRAFGAEKKPVLVHITPNHQYPVGGRLSASRRQHLISHAQRHGTLILENDYGCEFTYEGSDYPTLYSMAPKNTILLGTFANAASPALRIGFAVAPAPAARNVASWIGQAHQQASWPAQKIMEELLRSGELDRHIRRSRRHYLSIRRLIHKQLAPLSRYIAVQGNGAGMLVALRGQTRSIDCALQAALKANGVRFQPMADLAGPGSNPTGFLFGYGHMELSTVQESLKLLLSCIDDMVARGFGHG
jgi:GntR family transcriptional regulator/MocR family aminotransferase